jgi:aryl-alcohol dehydrogenase-like predicted oxidoreductase
MRKFGRLGWQVSEIGHGMWGMGSWGGSDDLESLETLEHSLELGCNFYDSAHGYGSTNPEDGPQPGRSDRLMGKLIRQHPDKKIYSASKIPPLNDMWPAPKNAPLEEMFPRDYTLKMAQTIRDDIGVETLDLLQFHTWDDSLATNHEWQQIVSDLKAEGLCKGVGISVNTFDASNGVEAVKTGLIDSVQVVYNIFTQDADDSLFPACAQNNVAVIARVPFDEGSLTGNFSADTTFVRGDWRNTYFGSGNKANTLKRLEEVNDLVPANMTMAQMALAFILANPVVCTTIPGMRKRKNVDDNMSAMNMTISPDLLQKLKELRWDRSRDDVYAN